MTKTEPVTFRSRYSRAELSERFGNVSQKINELVAREIEGAGPQDWRDILKRPRPSISRKEFERWMVKE